MNIAIAIFDGFDELDVIGPLGVLRRAQHHAPDMAVDLLTAEPRTFVRSAHGVELVPDASYAEPPDVLVLPGGGWLDRAPEGVYGEIERGTWVEPIGAVHAAGGTILTVCTGALLLAATGLLEGRNATTHHAAYDDLEAYGARVHPDRVVDDGQLITCGGVTSGIDGALWLVARELSGQVAASIAADLEHEWVRAHQA